MIHRSLIHLIALPGALLTISSAAHAQSDLAPPNVRGQVVSDAVRIAEMRGAAVTVPEPLPNPFIPKTSEVEVVPDTTTPPPETAPVLGGAELLAKLAVRVPATGTVNLGGEPILLLGQKRLKVGDTVTISFEGQSYELSIAAVTSTSFTVKRGENIYTRPVRISAVSTNTPTNRP
jgi:ribosomal 50S subunit-recycling heat shock protein